MRSHKSGSCSQVTIHIFIMIHLKIRVLLQFQDLSEFLSYAPKSFVLIREKSSLSERPPKLFYISLPEGCKDTTIHHINLLANYIRHFQSCFTKIKPPTISNFQWPSLTFNRQYYCHLFFIAKCDGGSLWWWCMWSEKTKKRHVLNYYCNRCITNLLRGLSFKPLLKSHDISWKNCSLFNGHLLTCQPLTPGQL